MAVKEQNSLAAIFVFRGISMNRENQIIMLDEIKDKLVKKNIVTVKENDDLYKCPTCGQIFTGEDIIKYGYKWCYSCGQRIDFTLPRNRFN